MEISITTSTTDNPPMSTTLKVVLLGDLGVGKTCLRSQFVHHVFTNGYRATIGGDYLTMGVSVPHSTTKGLPRGNDGNDRNFPTLATTSPSEPWHSSGQTWPKLHNQPNHHHGENTTSLKNTKDPLKLQAKSLSIEQINASNLTTSTSMILAVSQESVAPEPISSAQRVNLQIWDTAGQERFNAISQAFYRGTDVVVLVYDVTNYESVLSIRDWFARFLQHCHVERPGVIIVGNKIDKAAERCVDRDEIRHLITANTSVSVEHYVEDWETDVVEITCKRLDLVELLFLRVAQIGLAIKDSPEPTRNMQGFDGIDLTIKQAAPGCAC